MLININKHNNSLKAYSSKLLTHYISFHSQKETGVRRNDPLRGKGSNETHFESDNHLIQNNKSLPRLLNPSRYEHPNSFSRKLSITQHNDLYKEITRNCQNSRSINLRTPGYSEESSELGTSSELEERSQSTEISEVCIY